MEASEEEREMAEAKLARLVARDMDGSDGASE